MKCLIFSDSHGNISHMQSALNLHKDAEVVFFLGDGLGDAEMLSEFDSTKTWFFVRGNCDFRSTVLGREIPKIDNVMLCGKKIVFTHGDLFSVKYGDEGLHALSAETKADIILFGHTHTPGEFYHDGVYYFNPGSISGYSPSYGVLSLDENCILFSVGSFY